MENPTNPSAVSSSIPYAIIASVVIVLIGTLAIFGVVLIRPDKDNSVIFTTIGIGITPTLAAILALLQAKETHLVVNSRFNEVVEASRAVARVEAVAEERKRVANLPLGPGALIDPAGVPLTTQTPVAPVFKPAPVPAGATATTVDPVLAGTPVDLVIGRPRA